MFRPSRRSLRAALLAAVAFSALTACSVVVPRPKVQQPPETGRVTFQPEQAVIELPAEANDLLAISYDKGNPLPGDLVGPVEVKNMPLEDVIRLVTRANKIAVAVGAGAEDRTISISIPDRIPLAKVVDLLVAQAGAFYRYDSGVLHIEGERTFSVRVPNVLTHTTYKDLSEAETDIERKSGFAGDDEAEEKVAKDPGQAFSTIDAFAQSFTDLGASQVSPNNRTGLITFFADKQTYQNVAKFLRNFEMNRDLIIYDAWIYEVQLSDAKQAGIDWNDFSKTIGENFDLSLNSGLGKVAADTGSAEDAVASALTLPSSGQLLRGAGGVTLGVMGTPGAYAIDAMFQFLNGQGEAKTLAQPTISVIGGRESSVFVGESLAYIGQIETSNNGDSNSDDGDDEDTDNNDVGSTDVSTRLLKTGISLGITGDVTNGVVETNIGLSFVELLSLSNVEIKGFVLQLPRTAGRSINTTILARPGDVIMLGGLIYDRGSRAEDGLLIGDIPLKANAESNRRELVIMLRPRLVKFRPDESAIKKAFTEEPLVIGPEELPEDNANSTSVVTPEAPADVIMRRSATTEQQVIDGIKADPDAANLVDEARKAMESVVPLPAPQNHPAAPAKPADQPAAK